MTRAERAAAYLDSAGVFDPTMLTAGNELPKPVQDVTARMFVYDDGSVLCVQDDDNPLYMFVDGPARRFERGED